MKVRVKSVKEIRELFGDENGFVESAGIELNKEFAKYCGLEFEVYSEALFCSFIGVKVDSEIVNIPEAWTDVVDEKCYLLSDIIELLMYAKDVTEDDIMKFIRFFEVKYCENEEGEIPLEANLIRFLMESDIVGDLLSMKNSLDKFIDYFSS